MKLHWSPRSPFVRKVMIVLHETGLVDQVTLVRSVVAFAAPPNPAVLADNPLGQIPALVLADGHTLFDSRVICEYLDGLHQGRRLFPDGPARVDQLRWQALGDGLTAMLLTLRTERLRTHPDQMIDAALTTKINAAMTSLDQGSAALQDQPFGIGQIAVICAVGQIDFRFGAANWRAHFPALATWADALASRPSVTNTAVVDDSAPANSAPSLERLDFSQ